MAKWYVGVLKTGDHSVRKTRPSRREARNVFGPYSTKRVACSVAAFEADGTSRVRGCKGLTIKAPGGNPASPDKLTFLKGARRKRKR